MATRLTLKNDQWIDVKDKVKVRDKSDVHSFSVDGVSSDGKSYLIDVVKHLIGTAAVRISSWSVKGEDGKPLVWPLGKSSFKERTDILMNLDEDVFDDLSDVLSKHLKALDGEADEEKKEIPAGETPSGPSSPSVN